MSDSFFYLAELFIPNPNGGERIHAAFNSTNSAGRLEDPDEDLLSFGTFEPQNFEIARNIENKSFEITLFLNNDLPFDLADLFASTRIVTETGFRYRIFQGNQSRILMYGLLEKITLTNLKITLTINSIINKLDYTQVFKTSSNCRKELYSQECGVIPSLFTFDYTIATISADRLSFTTVEELVPNQFINGSVKYGNLDLFFDISTNIEHAVLLWDSIPKSVQIGDSVQLRFGCRKTESECINTFNNFIRFGGTPTGNNWLISSIQAIAGTKNLN